VVGGTKVQRRLGQRKERGITSMLELRVMMTSTLTLPRRSYRSFRKRRIH